MTYTTHRVICLISLLLVGATSFRPANALQAGDPYADRVVSFQPGDPASERFRDADAVLGPPDFNESAMTGWLTLGVGGSVTVEFVDNVVVNGTGPDIEIFGDPANDEQWKVEVSPDGLDYASFGLVNERAALDLDQFGMETVRFVRITDDSDPSGGISPGAELDAVEALNSESVGAPGPRSEVTEPAPPVNISDLSWFRAGGPPGGLGYDIRYNFDDPNTWYVTDANAGVHISRNNGSTWKQSNDGIDTLSGAAGDSIPVFSLTVDPHDPNILWIGTDKTGRIYKSTNGGTTWVAKDQGVIHDPALLMSFRGFTVDPRTSETVYAMAEVARPGNNVWGLNVGGVVYKTTDGGEHWTRIWNGGLPSSLARYLWIDPRNPEVLFVSTGIFDRGAVGEGNVARDIDPFGGLGILKSTDGGRTWEVLGRENGLEFLYIGSLYMHPDDPDLLLAAAGHVVPEQTAEYYSRQGHSPMGVYRTTDGGETWTQVLEPAGEHLVQVFSAVEVCPSDTNIVYAGSDLAVFRSEDRGETWRQVSVGSGQWGPPAVRAGWPIDLQCDPRDPDRVFANNYSGGNFLSEDGGRTWANASSGYSGAQIIGVAVDPFDPARVFAVGRSGGWYSEDAGTTWNGLHDPGDDTPLAGGEWGGIAFDPIRQNHIIAAGQNGILVWFPEGNRWEQMNYPPNFYPETSVIVFAPSDTDVIYAGSANHNTMVHDVYEQGHGIMVSRDGGRTWREISGEEFRDALVTDLAVSPTDSQVLYAATSKGLFKTLNGGGRWTKISALSSGEPVRTVAVSPEEPENLLAGISGKGLFISRDGGLSWSRVSAGLEPNGNHRDIVFDPVNPIVVYTSDISSGVYRSEDGGETWVKLGQGLTHRAATSLSISSDGLHLYAGTAGGGVFRLDLNGQPPVSAPRPEPVSPTQTESQPMPAPTEKPESTPVPGSTGGQPCLSGAVLLPLVLAGWVWRRRRNDG